MSKTKVRIVIAIVLVAIFFIARFSGVGEYLTLEKVQEASESLKNYVENNYLLSVIFFILIYIFVVSFSIPGATMMTIASGFLYGFIGGIIYSAVGATIGASISFLFARYVIGDAIQKKYADKLKKFNRELKNNGTNYLFTLRLIPIFPFFLINLLSGLTNISFKTYFWITAVGIIPGGLVFIYAGNELNQIESINDILSINMLMVLIVIGLLGLIPVVYKKFKKVENSKKK